jgi:hypothetical protein
VAFHSVSSAEVAQAAATLAAGALSASGVDELLEAERLSDYALDVFWRIYDGMRVGIDTSELTETA